VLEVRGPVADALFEALWRYYSLPPSWRLYDDARDCLQDLIASNVEWAIASNFDSRLQGICRADPLLSRARAVFPSSDVGWRKPSSEFFRRVASATNLRPSEILLIGDDPIADYEGAIAAGWRAMLLNRSENSDAGELTTLADLTNHIRGS
jgi:putative hydrolase of the HAD superfamily